METETVAYFPTSPSRMKAADCLHFFRQQYVLKKDEPRESAATPINLLEGRFGHKVAEEYTKALIKKKLESDFDLFREMFDKVWETNRFIPESHYEGLKDFLHGFAEVHHIDPQYTWGAEINLALSWDLKKVDWKDPRVWLRMKLDQVDIKGEVAIIKDYKTQFYVPSEGEQKKNLQTVIYPFGLSVINSFIKEFIMIFYYMRWNKIQVFKFTREEVEQVEPRIRSFSERMAKKIADPESEWPALRCETCAICHLECPLAELGLEPIRTAERAVEAAMQVEALEDKRKKLKEDLKSYCKPASIREDTGKMVETNLGIYGFHPLTTIRGLKADAIAEFCQANGMDMNLFLKADTDKIKKLPDDNVKETIFGMGKESFSTRFSLEKKARTKDDEV